MIKNMNMLNRANSSFIIEQLAGMIGCSTFCPLLYEWLVLMGERVCCEVGFRVLTSIRPSSLTTAASWQISCNIEKEDK